MPLLLDAARALIPDRRGADVVGVWLA